MTQRSIARHLGVAPQTLSDWDKAWTDRTLETARRGRPRPRVTREVRAQIVEVIRETRGRIGAPTLKSCFPDATRSELRRLLVCYRNLHAYRPDHLTWSTPGRVWAADYTEPGQFVDGRYQYVLLVRDLASGCQLMSLPVEHATAETTVSALRLLFDVYGAPLVLKTDNGSHFTAVEVTDLLSAVGVTHLRSPPRLPRYP